MNLFEIINRLQMNERDYWDYYQGITVNPIASPQRANEFINEFFTLGSKEGIFQNQFINDENDRVIIEHTTHTIKTFFIGIYLQQQIDRYLSINSSVGTNYPFSYLWYLSCLFHDYGYRFEQKPLTESDYTRIAGLEERSIKRFYNTRLDYYKVLKTKIGIVAPNIPIKKMCYLANTFSVSAIRNENKLRRPYELCNKQCNGIITFSNGKETDVFSLIASMPEKGIIWIDDQRQRNENFKAALKTGECEELIKLIKTIYLEKREKSALGKKLTKTDAEIFKAAEKNLYEEFAVVLNIAPNEVIPYILEHIS